MKYDSMLHPYGRLRVPVFQPLCNQASFRKFALKLDGLLQILIWGVFEKNKTLGVNLNWHIIATPDVFGSRQKSIRNTLAIQYFTDALAQNRAYRRQPSRKIDGVGKVVSDHHENLFNLFQTINHKLPWFIVQIPTWALYYLTTLEVFDPFK
jgi:hypothetical protein